jgi:crotonobetainyl-CoA hydratase
MIDEIVLVERRDAVLIVTLNRPEALNAADARVATAVSDALHELESNPSLRVGVITGTGRAFCAGVDLKATARGEAVLVPGHPEWGFLGLTGRSVSKPLVAAVNGLALGGGAEAVFACDLAVMSEDAILGLPEVTRGVYPGGGGAIRLPRQVPQKLAMQMLLTGEPISATQALDWGLVNQLVPADKVLDAAVELARRIAANSPHSVRITKQLALQATAKGSTWDDAVWAANAELNDTVPSHPDAIEGAQAFVDRRAPQWRTP